jgi:hypothetical protein
VAGEFRLGGRPRFVRHDRGQSCTLVTGASAGIGAAFARALRARGERLVLVARRAERLEALARELGGTEAVTAIPLDLVSPGAAARLSAEVRQRGLEVELLVNCAGAGFTGSFHRQDEEALRAMVQLNVGAVVELTRAFLPGMVERQRGRIVNVASNAAFQPIPFHAVYAASKAFVLSFTEALAEELRGTGVRVQALCPGITDTEFLELSGTHAGLLVTRMPRLTAEEVVEASLGALDRARLRVVVGWPNRVVAGIERFVPAAIVRRVAGSLYRPAPGARR